MQRRRFCKLVAAAAGLRRIPLAAQSVTSSAPRAAGFDVPGDTVSKNGTFALSIPGRPDGTIDSKEIAVLDEITAWMQMYGGAIYDTRPWTISGEGPGSASAAVNGAGPGKLSARDIRFTRNKANTILYAFILGRPEATIQIQSLGTSRVQTMVKIGSVEWLGSQEAARFERSAAALEIQPPQQKLSIYANVLKIMLA